MTELTRKYSVKNYPVNPVNPVKKNGGAPGLYFMY